jgi:hypothetical protein
MIIHQENLDYTNHCAVPFGTSVQEHTEPTNTNSQHTITWHCIYLGYVNNKQGGHELLGPQTGDIITCHNVTPLPTTKSIIKLLHVLPVKL